MRKLPKSPNKKDTVKLRHPDFPTQFKEMRTMYRFETFDELWATFKREHLDLWNVYKNTKRPYLAPRTFQENATFQMKKEYDTGCYCICCEGFNELRRGTNGAITKIDAILDRVKAARNSNANADLVYFWLR